MRRRPAGRVGVDQETVGIDAPLEQVGGVNAVSHLPCGSGIDLSQQELEKLLDGQAQQVIGDGDRDRRAVGFYERDLRHESPTPGLLLACTRTTVVSVSRAIQKSGLRLRGEQGEGRGRANGVANQKRDLAKKRGHIG